MSASGGAGERELMRSEPDEHFLWTFSTDVTGRLVDGLLRAYETASEQYVVARGSNAQTFGYTLYHFAVHELDLEAAESGGLIELLHRSPSFRLRVGEYRLACHRVGTHAFENIWSSFPSNDGAIRQMVDEPWFPGMEPTMSTARGVVIAHMGNQEDGLQAVYLCIPARERNGMIVEWGVAHQVWSADSTSIPVHDAPMVADAAAEEIIEEPVVRRRAKENDAASQ